MAKLNANILFLCYSQDIQLRHLKPSHTLENLEHLLEQNVDIHVPTDPTKSIDIESHFPDLSGNDSESDGNYSIINLLNSFVN